MRVSRDLETRLFEPCQKGSVEPKQEQPVKGAIAPGIRESDRARGAEVYPFRRPFFTVDKKDSTSTSSGVVRRSKYSVTRCICFASR